METQSVYQHTIKFAAAKHAENNQTVPGTNLPYVVHLSNVAMEILITSQKTIDFNAEFAIQVALLHDTLEDTSATFEELEQQFTLDIANAVSALTKRNDIPKNERMSDSLHRIKELSKEVWAVKIADRITNLQSPPTHWSAEKIRAYQKEAIQILQTLNGANSYLENRLKEKIDEYSKY